MPPFCGSSSTRPERTSFRYNRVICDVCDNPDPTSELTLEPTADTKTCVPTSTPAPVRNTYWRHHDPCDLEAQPTIPRGARVHQENWFLKDEQKVQIENEISRKADLIEDYQTEQRRQKENLNTLSYTAELKQAQIKLKKQQQKCGFNRKDNVVPLPSLPQDPPMGSTNNNTFAHFTETSKAHRREAFHPKAMKAKQVVHALSLQNANSNIEAQFTDGKTTYDKKEVKQRSASVVPTIRVIPPKILNRHMPSIVNSGTRFTQTGARMANPQIQQVIHKRSDMSPQAIRHMSNISQQTSRQPRHQAGSPSPPASRRSSRQPSRRPSVDPDQEFANLVDA